MASAKIGIIIGIIVVIIVGVVSLSFDPEIQEIPQNPQLETEIVESEEHDFYIDDNGNKVIVIQVTDALSIDD